jgi:plastocyanin
MQVTMERQDGTLTLDALRAAAHPEYPPAQPPCAWAPPNWAETIRLTDNPNSEDPTNPFWYYPSEAVVKSGTTVVWVDQSAVPHSVTAEEVGGVRPFDSHPSCDAINAAACMKMNDVFVWKAIPTAQPLVINYFCRVRPSMRGTIVVVP